MKNQPPSKLLQCAEDGDPEAQYSLAAMYGAGDFLQKDDSQAARWYLAASQLGHVEAQRNLGLMLIYGEGVPRDFSVGMQWIEKAAIGGSIEAMQAMAVAYEHGLYEIVANADESEHWKQKAQKAEAGLNKSDNN